MSLSYWIGVKITESGLRCPCCNKENTADPFGDHQVGCGGNCDRIHRHDSLHDAIFTAAQSAGLSPRKEVDVPALVPGSRSLPADIYLPNWCRGQPAALYVSVISMLQPLTINGAVNTPGQVLHRKLERTERKQSIP